MDAQFQELIPFLRDKNPQVRQLALSNLLGQTPQGSPHRNIFFNGLSGGGGLKKPQETEVVRDLKLLCRDQLAVSHDAFRALVNLSDSPLIAPYLAEPSFLAFLVSYILHPDAICADLAAMLLSNLSASPAVCAALLNLKILVIPTNTSPSFYPTQSRSGTCAAPVPYPTQDPQEVLALPLLVDAFVDAAPVEAPGTETQRRRKGELHFLASVFANISTAPAGRLFFLTPRPSDAVRSTGPEEYPLAEIVAFTEHKDTIRRGGVASAIKNCAFHGPAHRAIVSPESDQVAISPSTQTAPGINALPYILLPLAGPEELDLDEQERLPSELQFLPPTKTREPDPVLRLTHVETLLLLCTHRWGRDFLRAHGVYEIVRGAHFEETVDRVSEHIERLVQLIKGDEAPEGEEREGGVEGGAAKVEEAESDDEDSRIVEV